MLSIVNMKIKSIYLHSKIEMMIVIWYYDVINNHYLKTLTDTSERNEDAVYYATIEQRSNMLTIILNW